MHTLAYLTSVLTVTAMLTVATVATVEALIEYFVDRYDYVAAYVSSMACFIAGFVCVLVANEWLANLCGMPE